MKTATFSQRSDITAQSVKHEATTAAANAEGSGISKRESREGRASAKKNQAFGSLERPSGQSSKKSTSSNKPWNPNRILRTVVKLGAIMATGRSMLTPANAKGVYSMRADPPTLASLQLCNSHDLEEVSMSLKAQNAFDPDMALLCTDEKTFQEYKTQRTPESLTNCYGDAIGFAARTDPGGYVPRKDGKFTCKSLIDGALKDGAVRAKDYTCPDSTRQMQFFLLKDRTDYHVISRGKEEATWMQKVSGTPRFPAITTGSPPPRLTTGGIAWFVKHEKGTKVDLQQALDYSIRCKEMLCSLPEKKTFRKHEEL